MTREDALDILAGTLEDVLARPNLAAPLRQRAKFDGWLKVELAHGLEQRGASVMLEPPTGLGKQRADLRVDLAQDMSLLVMLKTVCTSFRFPSVARRIRTITDDFAAIASDLRKLQQTPEPLQPLAVFAVSPVAAEDQRRQAQLDRHKVARLIMLWSHTGDMGEDFRHVIPIDSRWQQALRARGVDTEGWNLAHEDGCRVIEHELCRAAYDVGLLPVDADGAVFGWLVPAPEEDEPEVITEGVVGPAGPINLDADLHNANWLRQR